jgi:hypothetical protein
MQMLLNVRERELGIWMNMFINVKKCVVCETARISVTVDQIVSASAWPFRMLMRQATVEFACSARV